MTAVPVDPAQREPVLDVLRGAALVGILLVNVQLMGDPEVVEVLFLGVEASVGTFERVLGGLIGWLIAGKFISAFSILFGVGVALISERAIAAGRAPRRILARRFGVLAVAGIVHTVLLFPGDVLFLYGVTGFLLLAFLRVGDRTLELWITALFVLSAVALTAVALNDVGAMVDAEAAEGLGAALAAAERAYAAGSYVGVVRWNASLSAVVQSSALVSAPWTLALFLTGMLAHRRGLARDTVGRRMTLVRLARTALPVGLVLNLPLVLSGPLGGIRTSGQVAPWALVGQSLASSIGAPLLAVGYLSALAVVVVDRGADRGLRWRLAALGRIALTGYLLQSALALTVFLGLGVYGRTALLGEPILGRLVVVVGVWAVLLIVAPWWTARFRHGPVEWLWRWGTYGVRPRLRA